MDDKNLKLIRDCFFFFYFTGAVAYDKITLLSLIVSMDKSRDLFSLIISVKKTSIFR